MQRDYANCGKTDQVCCLQEYLAMRCEVFLDFDPVPYPCVEDRQGRGSRDLTRPHRVVRVAEDE